jgi:hypothetical protein
MALLRKSAVATPALPEEALEVPELGGEVAVRALLLRERIAFAVDKSDHFAKVARMLAECVTVEEERETAANGQIRTEVLRVPLFDVQGWEAWGAKHMNAALRIWDVARRLSGFDREDAEKN